MRSDCKLRRGKYLNNVIERHHRFIKKKVQASQCFKTAITATRALLRLFSSRSNALVKCPKVPPNTCWLWPLSIYLPFGD
ncbi:MAG: hypothetical protein H7Z38_08465 [Rubrivivax sp.]|nr:hypothetical protein [Pyrinomonadaceae bacterium]